MGIVSKMPGPAKFALGVALAALATSSLSGLALSKDKDDGDEEFSRRRLPGRPISILICERPMRPIPTNTLAIGFGNASFSTAFAVLAMLWSLCTLASRRPAPALPTLSSPASQSIGVDVPLTVDLTDRVSVYGGFSATTSRTDMTDWSNFSVSAWMVGFQADVSAGWQIDSDDHAANNGHEVGAGRAAGHGLPQYRPRIRLRPERG